MASRELERRLPKERPPHLLVEDIGFVFHSGMFIVHFQDVLFIHNHIAYDFSKSPSQSLSLTPLFFPESNGPQSQTQKPDASKKPFSQPKRLQFHSSPTLPPSASHGQGKSSCLLPFPPSGSVRDCMGSEEGLATGLGDGSASDTCAQQV